VRAASQRLWIFALVLTSAWAVPASAAEGALNVAISPEVAHLVREWRRAHGLPQAPEATVPGPVSDGRGAIRPALRLIGIDEVSASGLRISVVRSDAHWRVTIEAPGDDPDYVVDVADSIASRTSCEL